MHFSKTVLIRNLKKMTGVNKMELITSVEVRASSDYTVHIGKNLIDSIGTIIMNTLSNAGKLKNSEDVKLAVITDSNVAPLYLNRVCRSINGAGLRAVSFTFEAGEQSKNVHTLEDIWEFLAENQITRSDCIVALGGGVTGDISGFAAATYLRGIDFIQVPTTLLAAVDSSVGGKTAIDLKGGKNLAGAFLQPLTVICDTDTLATLPSDTLTDGLAECIKYAVLRGGKILDIFNDIPASDKENAYDSLKDYLPQIIAESVKIKAEYVFADEFDTGERKMLNLGHTFGHSLEKISNFKMTHGKAVSLGMSLITKSAEKLGYAEKGTSNALDTLLRKFHLPTELSDYTDSIPESEYANISEYALNDKKRAGNTISLVLPERIGKCILKETPVSEIKAYVSLGLSK